MNLKTTYIVRTLVALTITMLAFTGTGNARYIGKPAPPDKLWYQPGDTLHYPLVDRRGDPYTNPSRNTFDFSDTSFVKRNIEYDPVTKQYYIVEKIGSTYYRSPMTFSMDEFVNFQGHQDEVDYFKKRASLLSDMNRRLFKPKFKTSNDWFNRIVGNGKVEIKPTGYVDLMAGYTGQNIKNPTLPERARKNGGFDFNMNSQLQVDGNIGDKIKLPINYNTLANFDFENQLKLDYHGKDDEILKTFQAGNVNFTTKSTLIPGAQSLFGIKTQLQFGKLYVTSVLANQRSQRQSLGLQGGTATQSFSLTADEYEENRHFLLAQYFRNNFNTAMKQLPIVNSAVQIQRIEVWVTNRTGVTTDTRDVVALMDLGENAPYGPWVGTGDTKPRNDANNLYSTLVSNPANRNSSTVQSYLTGIGLQPVQDFEKTFARKLSPSDYYFNPQIGFLSLNQQLQPDEVLGVAYQYTYNGKVYQVGEFSQDVPPDSTGTSQKVLFLKLLKATSQRTNLPIWDLMMKNVYSVGFGQLDRQDFKLDVTYEEPSLGTKRYLPPDNVIAQYKGQPLLTQVNLDRLNSNNDPQPDGVFDFIEGFTVISSQSRIIFPVLEPFGHDLDYLYSNQTDRDKFLYYPLYDTIKAIAQNYANLNRFKITGQSRSSSSNSGDYQLGFNIPRGSVTVTAGGQTLQENVDYEINYDLGTLKIINQSILNSGLPVNVQYENQATFGIQQRNFMGLRLDYLANKNLSIGGTIVRLGERPFFTKQSYGEDPIRNTMYGLDVDYHNQVPRLSKWLDKLPFYSTKAMSSISAYAEAAVLKPGHAKQIGSGSAGTVYIDDFEGTRSAIDLRFPLISWTLASAPQKSPDANGNIMFPEAELNNDLSYGYNRAKLSWYNIEPVLQEKGNPSNPLGRNLAELSKPETRQVYQKELFPNKSTDYGQALLTTFDMTYYPREKGPYNFQSDPSKVNANGFLTNPQKSWGGIMRNIDQTDLETANIEFIEFWVQDPFYNHPMSTGGQLYLNLGNISEDILKDGKRQYENGLPTPTIPAAVDESTVWGRVPSNPQQVTNAFSNDPNDRAYQDVGYDGLQDSAEVRKFQPYLASLVTNFGTGSAIYQKASVDPSADDFKGYRDATYDQQNAGILQRYKDINNPNGNSPIASGNSQYTNAYTLYPDAEELNRDNTLNEVEEYFQYRMDIKPGMSVGSNFITDKREVQVTGLPDGSSRTETWYLFRVPIKDYTDKVGNIPDFKSIRFIRMFLTGFDDTVTMRFASFNMIRNQWRKFDYEIDTSGSYKNLPTNDPTQTDVLAVNLEENDQRQPIKYVSPPGVERQQQISNNNVAIFQNEQALSLRLNNLEKGQARGVFKTMNLDLTQYGELSMFIHEEAIQCDGCLSDNDLYAVIRLGNDVVGNYYEVRIPLKKTPFGATDSLAIWPAANNLDFDPQELVQLKTRRNSSGTAPSQYYSETQADGRIYAVIGNPNLGQIQAMVLAVQNAKLETASTEVWFNELRLSKLNERGGMAATGRVNITLADLGNLALSGNVRTAGFGTLEQNVNQRSRDNTYQFDASTNLDFGKLVPRKANIQIPVYAGITQVNTTPQYDPYDLDIKLKDKLKAASGSAKDSIRNSAVDVATTKTFTLTNVKKNRSGNKKPKVWDISNFDFNYSFIKMDHHSPLIENEEMRRTRGAIAYNFAPQPKFIEPFKKLIKSRTPWLALFRDANFNYTPSLLSVKADVFRQFGAIRPRNVGGGPYKIPETYDKYFTFDRYYILRWDITRSITIDYSAVNNARVDEPDGRIDTKAKKDSIKNNFFKGGRTTHYHQDASLTYTLPTSKIPFLDWTSVRASYSTKYDWLAASLLARDLGNTLGNTLTKNINGQFKFDDLYNKSRWLRAINNAQAQAKKPPVPDKNNKAKTDTLSTKKKSVKQKKDRSSVPEIGPVGRFFGKLLMSLKSVDVQYTEDMGTTLPGYMDSTKILGQNWRSREPGLGFLFGYQPDTSWINNFGSKGLLTHDTLFNSLIQQRYTQRLSIKAQLVPFRDFNIDLSLDKSFDKQYSELYKDTSAYDNVGLTRLSPLAAGSFSISYISFKTLFTHFDPNQVSETFRTFENYRILLSERLGKSNTYNGANPTPGADGYYQGYGRYSQDVILPAFIAAYTKQDPKSIKLFSNANPNLRSNPFSSLIPKPNWNVTYNGLSRLKGLDKIFTSFTLRHGYNSTISMNSFNTALLFDDPLHIGYPNFIDTLTGNYIPFFLVPNISIQEQFNPLISVDMSFVNQMGFRFEYKKSRQLSLSLIDYQLAENRSTEFTIGMDWRKRGVPFMKNVKIGKKGTKLDNDLTFRFDFSLRDDATSNSKLDQSTAYGTAGQKVVRIAPSIDYVLNSRVNLKLFFDQTRTIPKIATTAPVTNTRGGLQVRISLTQ